MTCRRVPATLQRAGILALASQCAWVAVDEKRSKSSPGQEHVLAQACPPLSASRGHVDRLTHTQTQRPPQTVALAPFHPPQCAPLPVANGPNTSGAPSAVTGCTIVALSDQTAWCGACRCHSGVQSVRCGKHFSSKRAAGASTSYKGPSGSCGVVGSFCTAARYAA